MMRRIRRRAGWARGSRPSASSRGGNYSLEDPSQRPDLDALSAFTNFAIPFPQNPHRAPDGVLSEAEKAELVAYLQTL
jgi:hypothetical protein